MTHDRTIKSILHFNAGRDPERYTFLVEGKSSPDQNYLLDLKLSSHSPVDRCFAVLQPQWQSEAERIAWGQRQMQAIATALLHAVELEGRSCIMKELQPSEDKVNSTSGTERSDVLKS